VENKINFYFGLIAESAIANSPVEQIFIPAKSYL